MAASRRSPAVLVGSILAAVLAAPAARAEPADVDQAARVVARALAEAIVAREPESAAALCTPPVNLDGEVAETEAAILDGWRRALDRRALRGVRIVSVEVVTLAEARSRYGPPPPRLGALPEGGATLVAILRLDRTQLVAVMARIDDRWTVVAVTD